LRPITLYPFPSGIIAERAKQVKGFLSVEMSSGQMVDDIKLAVFNAGCSVPVRYFGRMGGLLPSPGEVAEALENIYLKK
jgi:2-oxoglutarate ferredoxin oxidoreductase subunit alpha